MIFKLNSTMTDNIYFLLKRIEKGELKYICRKKYYPDNYESNESLRKRIKDLRK